MRAILLALMVTGPAQAQTDDWVALTGEEIVAVLSERLVEYDNGATQRFFASGRTLYTHGAPSWGRWEARGDQYCSLWPPSPDWDCYAVQSQMPDVIAFVHPAGSRTVGRIEAE